MTTSNPPLTPMREVASAMTIYADPLSDNISIADSGDGGRQNYAQAKTKTHSSADMNRSRMRVKFKLVFVLWPMLVGISMAA